MRPHGTPSHLVLKKKKKTITVTKLVVCTNLQVESLAYHNLILHSSISVGRSSGGRGGATSSLIAVGINEIISHV